MRGQKGITLVALVITIIVLLILAVVAIAAISDTELLTYANSSVNTHVQAADNELTTMNDYVNYIQNKVN